MSEIWIRFADADFDAYDWWRFDDDADAPGASGSGQGDMLSRLEPAAVCRVLVPQSLLLTLAVRLPPRASRQQLQAIGYAIEDQLANDVEDNHFAIGAQREDGSLPVVVIEREVMDRLLERLRQARLRCDAIHAEMLLCPVPESGAIATLCPSPGGWLLRLDQDEAMPLSAAMLDDTLAWLASREDDEPRFDCCTDSGALADHADWSCRPVECGPSRNRVKAAINLLQGDYRPGSRWRERLRPWKPVLWLLLGWLLVVIASAIVERVQMQHQLENLREQQWALIDRYLPGTEHRGDPKRLLVQRLSAQQQQGADGGVIERLAEFAAIRSAFPGLKVGRVLYRDAKLIIDLEGAQLKLFEALEQKLKQQGMDYRIENLDIGPSKTRARLILGSES